MSEISANLMTSVQFSCPVMSDSLPPRESQHAKPPCPSPTPGIYSNPCPSSRWCHPARLSTCQSSGIIHFFPTWASSLMQLYSCLICWQSLLLNHWLLRSCWEGFIWNPCCSLSALSSHHLPLWPCSRHHGGSAGPLKLLWPACVLLPWFGVFYLSVAPPVSFKLWSWF